jgi:hypothetical protein
MEQGILSRNQRSMPRELRKLRCETPCKCRVGGAKRTNTIHLAEVSF